MKRSLYLILLCVPLFWGSLAALAQETNELRFLCFNEGNECEIYADLLSRFSQENPDIAVAVEVMDGADIESHLSEAVDTGDGPDIARVADYRAFAGRYLDLRPLLADAGAFAGGFQPPFLEAMRAGAGDGLHGFPDAAAMVAPFVNISLFEQAGVSLPGAGSSWDDWLKALEAVALATGTPYLLAVDNKDHRLVGPAMSLGARYFDENGALTLADADGLREFLEILNQLKAAGRTPSDTLL